jgi:hypothetical protein
MGWTRSKLNHKTAYLRFPLSYRKCGCYVNVTRFHDIRVTFAQNITIIFSFDSINCLLQNYMYKIILSAHTFLVFLIHKQKRKRGNTDATAAGFQ